MDPEEKFVLDENDGAQYMTNLKGWVSRTGRYFGDHEERARYDGATHRRCPNEGCDRLALKHWLMCEKCREEKKQERFLALPALTVDQIPDGAMLYAENVDLWFASIDDLAEHLRDYEDTHGWHDVRVRIGEPVQAKTISPEDFLISAEFDGAFEPGEGVDLPQPVMDALITLNNAIVNANQNGDWKCYEILNNSPRLDVDSLRQFAQNRNKK